MRVNSPTVPAALPKALPYIAKLNTFACKYKLRLESPLSHEFIT